MLLVLFSFYASLFLPLSISRVTMPPKRPGRATAPVRFVPDNAEDEVDGEDGVGEKFVNMRL